MLAFTGDYIEPYGSPLGQVILAVLLSAYVATLLWMRRMAVAKPLPRFLDLPARNAHRAAQRTAPVENQGALA
jgi:tight adherence protein B